MISKMSQVRFISLSVADPKILKGWTEDKLSVPSSFIANAHNELYKEKGGFLKKYEPIGGGRPPTLWIRHCSHFAQRKIIVKLHNQ